MASRRSPTEAGPVPEAFMDRLTALMERVLIPADRPAHHVPHQFPAPTFDGVGDVELFLQQFQEVAAANGWTEPATLLHLKGALKGEAYQCSRPQTLAGVFQALRSRYTMTPREARATLSRLRRDQHTPLQQHATEVERLVALAHPELPAQYRLGMTVDLFCSSLGHPALQRHLLAVDLPTLDAAVQAGSAYLQVQAAPMFYNRPATRLMEEPEYSPEYSSPSPQVSTPEAELFTALQGLTQQLNRLVESRTAASLPAEQPAPVPPKAQAWGGAKKSQSGNGLGPQ